MSQIAARFDPTQQPQSGQFSSRISTRCGGIWVFNDSPAEVTITSQQLGITRVIPPGWVRSIRFSQAPASLDWQTSDILQTQGVSLISKTTVEAFEENEWPGDINTALPVRVSNIGNTVNTGTSVGQVTNIVYDQSAINGEPAGTVTSEAAAGSGAGLVDVTDTNATGGKRVFTMKTGTASIGADGAITAPAFHGNADSASAVPATGVEAGALPAGVTIAASQVGSGYPAANLTGSVPSATNATTAANLGGGITSGDDPTFHDTGINPQRPAGSARSLLLAPWDGTTQYNALSVGTSGFHAACWVGDDGTLHGPHGGGLSGIQAFSGTGSGVYTHGLNVAPAYVGVTSNQANSTETVGVDSIGSTTVHINTPQNWPFVAIAFSN